MKYGQKIFISEKKSFICWYRTRLYGVTPERQKYSDSDLLHLDLLSRPPYLSRYSDSLRVWTFRGSNPGGRRDFPHPSRTALVLTQAPVQFVPGLCPGGKAVGAWC